MFGVFFEGRLLRPSASAYGEMEELALSLDDMKNVLENGFDCPASRRKQGTLERCLREGNKVVRVVVAEDYTVSLEEPAWVVVHASRQSWKKKLER